MGERINKYTGKMIPTCDARTRRGEICKNYAMPNGRCRFHGGKSPGRPLTTGKHTKFKTETIEERAKVLEETLSDKAITTKEKQELEKFGLLEEIEKAKKDPAIRDFGTYLATAYVLLESVKKEISTLPNMIEIIDGVPVLPASLLNSIGSWIDLITKVLEREAKYKYSERFVLTIDEIRSLFSQILYAIQRICANCSKRDELSEAVNNAVIKLKEELR